MNQYGRVRLQPGEVFEHYWSCDNRAVRVKYRYLDDNGRLFECDAPDIQKARMWRDDWLTTGRWRR